MLIEEKPLQHWIDHFYGYGSWKAKIWFIGYEEGGGDLPEEVSEKLNYFFNAHAGATQATLCDIRDLYRHVTFRVDGPRAKLFRTLHDYRFDQNSNLHGLWKNLIAFTHGYRQEKVSDPLLYQRKHFASPESNEALIQLYPMPSPHAHAWYYAWLDMSGFSFLRNRAVYQDHVYEDRIGTILRNIAAYNPDVVVMYAMDNINKLKESVQGFFPGTDFKMVKAIKRQLPQHHRADLNGTRLVITTQVPALRHNRVETGFDWEEFGKIVRVTS